MKRNSEGISSGRVTESNAHVVTFSYLSAQDWWLSFKVVAHLNLGRRRAGPSLSTGESSYSGAEEEPRNRPLTFPNDPRFFE